MERGHHAPLHLWERKGSGQTNPVLKHLKERAIHVFPHIAGAKWVAKIEAAVLWLACA
jgi:hypothetical protein